jgi:YidC/Oxa1 family membrane protein insertase
MGQRGLPPNPQAQMMTYMMPVMMTIFGFSFASGLNLYWTASNLASLPQQWLIGKERMKRLNPSVVVNTKK